MSKRKELEDRMAEMAKELEEVKSGKPSKSSEPEANEAEAKPKRKRRTLKKIADLIGIDDKPSKKGMSLEVDDESEAGADETESIAADEDIAEIEADEDIAEAEADEIEADEAEADETNDTKSSGSTGSVLAPEPNVPLNEAFKPSTLKQIEEAKKKAREMRLEAVRLQDEAKKADKLILELEEKAKAEAEAEKKAKAEAAAKAEAEAKAKAIAEAKAKSRQPIIQSICQDGPRNAYRFWSSSRRVYLVTTDLWIAEQLCPGDWKTVKVWMKNGQIDHLLSEEEIVKYYNLL